MTILTALLGSLHHLSCYQAGPLHYPDHQSYPQFHQAWSLHLRYSPESLFRQDNAIALFHSYHQQLNPLGSDLIEYESHFPLIAGILLTFLQDSLLVFPVLHTFRPCLSPPSIILARNAEIYCEIKGYALIPTNWNLSLHEYVLFQSILVVQYTDPRFPILRSSANAPICFITYITNTHRT
jgi:hypothetical protein